MAEGGGNATLGTLMAMFAGIIGLAMVAVILSQKAQTSAIIQAFASGTSAVIGAAVAPVTQSGNAFNQ